LQTLEGHKDGVFAVAFVVTPSVPDDSPKTLRAATIKNLNEIDDDSDEPSSSPSYRVHSASWDKTVKTWDVEKGTLEGTLELAEHTDFITSVAWSRDGTRLVSGSEDRTLRIWDMGTGKCLITMEGHISGVSCVQFSRDSKKVASGSHDQTVRIWDSVTGVELCRFEGHTQGVMCVVTQLSTQPNAPRQTLLPPLTRPAPLGVEPYR
jgi:WD40 repeat protein